jgi:hypothetical protein
LSCEQLSENEKWKKNIWNPKLESEKNKQTFDRKKNNAYDQQPGNIDPVSKLKTILVYNIKGGFIKNTRNEPPHIQILTQH